MGTDYNALRLKYHGDIVKTDEILQMECRDKCSKKLPLTLLNDRFRFPSLALAEMCTSDAVAEVHASLVKPGSRVVDMTAGLGIDCLHFAQKGCSVTAIEIDPTAADTLDRNVREMKLENRINVINADSMEWIRQSDMHFDTIFIDPARRDDKGRHFALAHCVPDITASVPMLLKKCDFLVVKASPMIDIASGMRELGIAICEVVVIGSATECKEVVYIIRNSDCKSGEAGVSMVKCVTVGKGCYAVEHVGMPGIMDRSPKAGDVMMIPYPSVMKGLVGNVSGFRKLHNNSHLYVADSANNDFPGQKFSIVEVIQFNKREIRDFRLRYPKTNVMTRNFPLSAPELSKRLKVMEGGNIYVMGTTLHDESKVLVVMAEPV